MLYNINFRTGKLEPIDETSGDKNNLPVGTVLHLNGYDDPDYVITGNRGINPKFASYGARYDHVSLKTGEAGCSDAYTLMWERDRKDNRIQKYITDRIMDREEMQWALIAAAATKAENDRLKAIETEKKANEKAALPSRFPYLTAGDSSEKNGAANIRIELKRAFPSVKFSVKIETRGTSSINIHWTDGPTTAMVEKFTAKYQEGHFNGMEDIYERDHENQFPDIFGGARYVFENRRESPELIQKAAKELGFEIATGESDNCGVLPGLDREQSQQVYRQAYQMAVTDGETHVTPERSEGLRLAC